MPGLCAVAVVAHVATFDVVVVTVAVNDRSLGYLYRLGSYSVDGIKVTTVP